MRIGRRAVMGLGLAAAGAVGAAASTATDPALPAPEIVALWPHGPPGGAPPGLKEQTEERGQPGRSDRAISGVVEPRLEIYRPTVGQERRAIVVIPGGGYQRLAMDKEGRGMARWLAARGVTACVLIHRLPGEGWAERSLVALQDAQRAMRIIRGRAQSLDVDAARVEVIGFSAGGHLAGSLATQASRPTYAAVDAADALSARPARAGLIYPVITMESRNAHAGSRRNLLGDNPTEPAVIEWSVDNQVTVETPPTFLVHAADDPVVPVENSLMMFRALQASRIPSELHVFEHGGHGFGLTVKTTAQAWMELYMRWRREG